jgi:phosphoribosylglycinamide formyltransferase-1
VVASGAGQSAACVHVVDEEYDHGPVLARLTIPLQPGDTAEDLERRVTAAEPGFFVDTLRAIAEGRLALPALPSGPERAKSAS